MALPLSDVNHMAGRAHSTCDTYTRDRNVVWKVFIDAPNHMIYPPIECPDVYLLSSWTWAHRKKA